MFTHRSENNRSSKIDPKSKPLADRNFRENCSKHRSLFFSTRLASLVDYGYSL